LRVFIETAIDTGGKRALVYRMRFGPVWLVVQDWIVDERTQIDARYS
jgi:hypothetical protein